MKEPYQSAITSLLPKFESIGFQIIENSDYSIKLSDETHSILMAIEHYYPLTLMISMSDRSDVYREAGLLQSCIDSSRTQDEQREMKAMVRELELEKKSFEQMNDDGSLYRYIHRAVEQTIEFISAHPKEMLDVPVAIAEQYSIKERASLARFGIFKA